MRRRVRSQGPDEITLEAELDREWKAEYSVVIREGRAVTREIRISPIREMPAGGLTASVLRRVRVGAPMAFASEIRRWREKLAGFGIGFRDQTSGQVLTKLAAAGQGKSRRGRPRIPDLELAKLARDYVRLLREKAKRPIVELATKHGLGEAQARSRIHKARKRGFLEAATILQGLPGGDLTEKAKRVLKEGARHVRKK